MLDDLVASGVDDCINVNSAPGEVILRRYQRGFIRDQEAANDKVPFYFFNDCFPGSKITPTDIDQAQERNGHFLFIEYKREGNRIPMGQIIFFQKLKALRVDKVTVLFAWANPPLVNGDITAMQLLGGSRVEANMRDIVNFVYEWFVKVNGKTTTHAISLN